MDDYPEIAKLKNALKRLNVDLRNVSLGQCLAAEFYYIGGNCRNKPYFITSVVDFSSEMFIHKAILRLSGYDISVTDLDNPQNDFHLEIPRFQNLAQLEMLLDIRGVK